MPSQSSGVFHHIYEEVVSGDSIADRPETRKILAAVEAGESEGALVMEVPRLARENTRAQGEAAETFQYSGTKIITPEKAYDPAGEADGERRGTVRPVPLLAALPPYGYHVPFGWRCGVSFAGTFTAPLLPGRN